ncbi:hypothetical protein M427DRAFT_59368 [Gonapodya prolifera JEL478]|uniref:Uncharacterized protein n=1 Tax=Gonapodya prolifera (strain JEL478) TaxID=1344416 RepID=A0A139A771_GONPJ|nr:hypothetical protein M427DRAFT_59368 [Gonapodya prolifera JEL478]|eukprot:KXS12631.1 hypothetical protein M427DRAFT_59368 [Gonapodya prolifera JEL478]
MDQVGKSVVLTRGVTVLENLGPSLSSFFTPQITFESHLTQLNVPSLLECLDLLRSKAFTATDVPQDEVAARARESLTSFFDEDSIMEAVDRAEIPQGHLRESASGIDEEVVGEIETAESSDVTDLASSTTAISQYTAASVRLLLLFAHRVPTMSDAPPVVGGRARDIAVSLLAGIKRLSTRHASIVSSDDVKVVHVNAEKATSIVMEALGAVGDIVKQRAGSAAATHS